MSISKEQSDIAPANFLPSWEECRLRVVNSTFIEKRVAEGGYGPDADSLVASQLHKFIYEYDDNNPYRSDWFLHRLELVLEENKKAAAEEAESLRGIITEATNIAHAQDGNLIARIIHMKDEIESLRAQLAKVMNWQTTEVKE